MVISTDPPRAALNLPVVKELGKAKAMYNEKTNKTIIETIPVLVFGDWNNGMRLRARFEVSGKEIAKPAQVTLYFYSTAPNRKYADNRALKISIDGKAVVSGTARYQEGETNGKQFYVTVSQDISYEMYLQLINAKAVKMQIGLAQFDLKESDLEALRDLTRIIE
ncbi:MAG: hypothetical protein ABJA66_14350 [Actinomycetota bacterium]